MSDSISAATDETVFNVDTMLKYMGNDANALAVVTRIVRDAIAPGGGQLELAGAAVREGRIADACRVFHVMRGTIGSLGAKRFVRTALALEVALREGRGEQFETLLAAVTVEYQLMLEQATAWLQHRGASA
jgi:hypothetical protein